MPIVHGVVLVRLNSSPHWKQRRFKHLGSQIDATTYSLSVYKSKVCHLNFQASELDDNIFETVGRCFPS